MVSALMTIELTEQELEIVVFCLASTIVLDQSEGQVFEAGCLTVAQALHARLWPMWASGKVG
jgi:hypothetical protein